MATGKTNREIDGIHEDRLARVGVGEEVRVGARLFLEELAEDEARLERGYRSGGHFSCAREVAFEEYATRGREERSAECRSFQEHQTLLLPWAVLWPDVRTKKAAGDRQQAVGTNTRAFSPIRVPDCPLIFDTTKTKIKISIYRDGARHPRHLNARVGVLLLLK